MATRKSSSKPALAAVPHRAKASSAEAAEVSAANLRAFAFRSVEAMETCANVLALLNDYHVRKSDCTQEDAIESGEAYVLGHLRDLLKEEAYTLHSAAEDNDREPELVREAANHG